jgi:hypothetical protein
VGPFGRSEIRRRSPRPEALLELKPGGAVGINGTALPIRRRAYEAHATGPSGMGANSVPVQSRYRKQRSKSPSGQPSYCPAMASDRKVCHTGKPARRLAPSDASRVGRRPNRRCSRPRPTH